MGLDTEKKSSAGFSLIELMIAMAIAGIMIAAIYGVFEAQVREQVSQDVSLQMTQDLRSAMEIMAADIRMAGCDPTEDADAEIVLADVDELQITMDIRGDAPTDGPDGDTDDPGEDVRYAINASDNLGRETMDASGNPSGLQPLHSVGMQCDALNFVYLTDDEDGDGDPDVLPTPVTGDDLDDIRAIQVSIVLRSADTANPGFLAPFTDNTRYTNLQGQVIFTPDATNNQFRRLQLSNTIACRNL